MRTAAERKQARIARAFGPIERVRWIQNLPCRVCGATPSENMHTMGGGTGRKGPYQSIIPCCTRHHAEAHQHGQKTFAKKHGLNLEALAAEVEAMWARHSGGERSLFDSTPTWVNEEGV